MRRIVARINSSVVIEARRHYRRLTRAARAASLQASQGSWMRLRTFLLSRNAWAPFAWLGKLRKRCALARRHSPYCSRSCGCPGGRELS